MMTRDSISQGTGVSRFPFPLSKTYMGTGVSVRIPITPYLFPRYLETRRKHPETLGNTNPLAPTCPEEAEALKKAPKWDWFLIKQTIKQLLRKTK